MANKFPYTEVLLTGTFALEHGKGKGFKVSTTSPPSFVPGTIGSYDAAAEELKDLDPASPGDLVLVLEVLPDPFFEAEGRDDHVKDMVSGIFVKGLRAMMSSGGAAFASSHIGVERPVKIDAGTKLPYVDLADTTSTATVRVLGLASKFYPTMNASTGNIEELALPEVGDTQAPIIVEFLK